MDPAMSSSSAGSASARAYEFTKWAILSAVYPAGSQITEAGLAHEIGLSRTPVHQALLRLEVEGLVTLRAGRGAVVDTFTMHDVEDVHGERVHDRSAPRPQRHQRSEEHTSELHSPLHLVCR